MRGTRFQIYSPTDLTTGVGRYRLNRLTNSRIAHLLVQRCTSHFLVTSTVLEQKIPIQEVNIDRVGVTFCCKWTRVTPLFFCRETTIVSITLGV
jgi:hypothetical protein